MGWHVAVGTSHAAVMGALERSSFAGTVALFLSIIGALTTGSRFSGASQRSALPGRGEGVPADGVVCGTDGSMGEYSPAGERSSVCALSLMAAAGE